MKILYIDIDSLRPDHLGCYGYHRNTSPNIDALAAEGVRFDNVYISDAPCLPSRTALFSGRCGFHTGVIDHGGRASSPFIDDSRGFRDPFSLTSWPSLLQQQGYYTASISAFGQRHSAWHWYAGFHEVHAHIKNGNERADEVTPVALDWLDKHGDKEDWFLHFNVWDPHTPYRAPAEFGNPFENDPLPAHITKEYWQAAWNGYGPHSPQEVNSFSDQAPHLHWWDGPNQLDSMETVRWWIDHYDISIRWADKHVGLIIEKLNQLSILDDTLIMISADHGENQGELNVWGDHQTADEITCHIPLIVRGPQVEAPWVDTALHYHFDWAATVLELAGSPVPDNWDGVPFTEAFTNGQESGREFLVTSQGAWSCQRGIRFDHEGTPYILLRTYHDGYKMMDDLMLFDLANDPHEQHNLAESEPEIVNQGLAYLEQWLTEMKATAISDVDPMMTVLRQGGAFHTRGHLPAYLERLRATGRAHHADYLEKKHPAETE